MALFNINWNRSVSQSITITRNITFSFSNGILGGKYFLQVKFAGPHSVSWPSNVAWADGINPIQTSSSGKMDVFKFIYDGVCYHGQVFGADYTVP
jgi:hypothetical protein